MWEGVGEGCTFSLRICAFNSAFLSTNASISSLFERDGSMVMLRLMLILECPTIGVIPTVPMGYSRE